MIIAYVFTMAEYLWLLRCLQIGVKNKYFIVLGFLVLALIGLVCPSSIGVGKEAYISIRVAFVFLVVMIDKEKLFPKVESAFLVAIIKDCILLAVETWIPSTLFANVTIKRLDTLVCFFAECLTIIILGVLLKKLINILDSEKIVKAGSVLDYIIVIGSFTIFTCIWLVYSLVIKGFYTELRIKEITSFAAVALLLLEINIIYKKWLADRVQKYAKAEHELYETQKNYYQSLLEKESDTKKYRHDMNNHMICIKSLLDEGNYADLHKYIDKLCDYTNFLVNKSQKTGNSIIDALTNYYADSMDKDVEFKLKGMIAKPIDIDEISLSSIYSNMLVNAIEAQTHIPPQKERYIHVSLKEGDKFAQLIVRNAMENESIANLEQIETTKLDKENHGFGLANIKKNVAEHNGDLVIEAEDYEFCIKATLPLVANQ